MMQPDNSYFDENSLVSQPPPPPEKKKPWLTISILANILLLLATIGSVIMWMNAKKQVTQLTNDNNMLRGQIASGSMTPMVPMSGGNQNNCGLDRFRGSDLGLVAVFYNNLGEEIPLKVATAGGNKTASLVLAPDSHYQVDHLERLSFSANGKNSSTAALCIDIPRTALPPGECVKGNETCER